MAGWHHRLNGHESEWTPGVGDGQGGLACCDSWGREESDTTERLNWTELAWKVPLVSLIFLKRSLVLPILLFSSISLHWSLRKAFLSLLAILWNSAFRWIYLLFCPLPFASPLPSAISKAYSDNHFAFLHLFFLRWLSIQRPFSLPHRQPTVFFLRARVVFPPWSALSRFLLKMTPVVLD